MTSVKVRAVARDESAETVAVPPDVRIDSMERLDAVPRAADEQLKRWHQQGLAAAHNKESNSPHASGQTLAPATLDAYDFRSLYLILWLLGSVLCLGGVVAKIRTYFRKQQAIQRRTQKKTK